MKRRALLGGLLAGAGMLAAAGDALALRSQWPRRARVTSYRIARWRWRRLRDDVPNISFAESNKLAIAAPASERRVVMLGDSITNGWERQARPLFQQHGLVARGIGGETSAQMLLRFKPDVVELKPQAVHIMAGTNDIAAPYRPYDPDLTRRNIEAMADLAKQNGIAVILASVPPITAFSKLTSLRSLNAWINDLCVRSGYTYCDYWPVLHGPGDRMKAGYSRDGLHPNPRAYTAMAPLLLAAIDQALKSQNALTNGDRDF
jgi:lysophospholipase L1-like esterase